MQSLITCHTCGFQLSVSESLLTNHTAGHKVSIRCKQCNATISWDAAAPAGTAADTTRAPAPVPRPASNVPSVARRRPPPPPRRAKTSTSAGTPSTPESSLAATSSGANDANVSAVVADAADEALSASELRAGLASEPPPDDGTSGFGVPSGSGLVRKPFPSSATGFDSGAVFARDVAEREVTPPSVVLDAATAVVPEASVAADSSPEAAPAADAAPSARPKRGRVRAAVIACAVFGAAGAAAAVGLRPPSAVATRATEASQAEHRPAASPSDVESPAPSEAGTAPAEAGTAPAEAPSPVPSQAGAPASDPPAGQAPVGSTQNEFPPYVSAPVVQTFLDIARRRAERCHPEGHAVGTATMFVTFTPDGKVSEARLEGEPVASAPVARCILDHARAIRIPKFDGAPFTARQVVRMR